MSERVYQGDIKKCNDDIPGCKTLGNILIAAGLPAQDVNFCMDKADMVALARDSGILRAGDNPDPDALTDILGSTPHSSAGARKAAPVAPSRSDNGKLRLAAVQRMSEKALVDWLKENEVSERDIGYTCDVDELVDLACDMGLVHADDVQLRQIAGEAVSREEAPNPSSGSSTRQRLARAKEQVDDDAKFYDEETRRQRAREAKAKAAVQPKAQIRPINSKSDEQCLADENKTLTLLLSELERNTTLNAENKRLKLVLSGGDRETVPPQQQAPRQSGTTATSMRKKLAKAKGR